MIRVLVVDDDFRVAQVHSQYVGACPGFEVVGLAHNAADAVRLAEERGPDLVLLDEYLPDAPGSSVIGRLDAAVIVVSAADDAASVRRALAAGAVNYVLKPFPPAQLVERLTAFARVWQLLGSDRQVDQGAVARALAVLREGDSPSAAMAKGRSVFTAEAVRDALQAAREAKTAAEVADAVGVSRATAQRYLSDLARAGRVELTLRYGATGRPEHRYAWRGAGG